MPKCQDITPKRKKICIGALRYKVDINNRNLKGPTNFSSEAHFEEYTLFKTVSAAIETKDDGKFQIFNGVAIDPNLTVTHVFTIRFTDGVTTEQFIQYKGINYKILKRVNIDEQDRWLKLNCRASGDFDKQGAR